MTFMFFITGCSNVKTLEISPENNIINKESALQIRDVQIRTFENTSKENLINAIVDSLLDDGYFITMIDTEAGVISAKNSKKNTELNLVSVIKEVKDNNFAVRFSITAIDRSAVFNSYIVVQDDLIYRYLFDKLRKSLFLDKDFYQVPTKEKPIAQKELVIVEKHIEPKVVTKYVEKKAIQGCSTKKCQNSSSLIYSVQFLCTADKQLAQKEFEKLKNEGLDVIIHPYYEYQVVRLGRYKNRIEAENTMQKFKNNYPEITITAFKPKR